MMFWVLSLPAQAESLSLQLGDDVARLFYNTARTGDNGGRLEIESGLLYTDNNDYMLSLGALVRGESVEMPIIVAVGGRIYYGDFDPLSITALAIGGDMMIRPASWKGFGIGLHYYHAPSVTAGGDAENLTDMGITFNLQVTPQADIFAGVQRVESDIVNLGELEIDDNAFVGIKMHF